MPVNVLGIDTVKISLEEPPALPAEEPEKFPGMIYGVVFLAIVFVILIVVVLSRLKKPERPSAASANDDRPEPGKSSYVGRLNIYITRTASGYDIAPLSYDLFRLP